VPDQIRSLCNPDPKPREQALWQLYGNIFHQGTRYQATPYAIPFLYELIRDPKTPARDQIVYLLVNLALGYEEACLPGGVDSTVLKRYFEEADSQLSASQRAHCDKYGFGPRVELECYGAVEKGVAVLMPLVDDPDIHLGRAAVYSLAWFPSYAAGSIPRIRHRLASESNDAGIANAVLAIGLLARRSHNENEFAPLKPFLQHSSFLVRTASAIAQATNPLDDLVLAALLKAITSPEPLQGLENEIRFNAGDLAGYAGLVLAAGGASARVKIIPALRVPVSEN
jgi:hypothetical protein